MSIEMERQAFEQHPRFRGMDFTRAEIHPEYYASPYANGALDGWLAGRSTRPAQTEQQPIYLYRRKGQDAFASCDFERFEELSAHHLFETKVAYAAPVAQPAQTELVEALRNSDHSPVDQAADEIKLRKDFESRWPVPKGVTWGAGVGDYCVSEFASGIALSYPDMWMAYKAGAARAEV